MVEPRLVAELSSCRTAISSVAENGSTCLAKTNGFSDMETQSVWDTNLSSSRALASSEDLVRRPSLSGWLLERGLLRTLGNQGIFSTHTAHSHQSQDGRPEPNLWWICTRTAELWS